LRWLTRRGFEPYRLLALALSLLYDVLRLSGLVAGYVALLGGWGGLGV